MPHPLLDLDKVLAAHYEANDSREIPCLFSLSPSGIGRPPKMKPR